MRVSHGSHARPVWFARNVAAVLTLLLFAGLVCFAGYLATDIVPPTYAKATDAAWWKERFSKEKALSTWTDFVSWVRGKAYPKTRDFCRDEVYPLMKRAAKETEQAWKEAEKKSP